MFIIKKIKENKAVETVEFCAMLFFLMIFLTMLFTGGQIVINKMVLNYATQQAARKVAVMPKDNQSEVTATIQTTVNDIIKRDGIGLHCYIIGYQNTDGDKGQVAMITAYASCDTLFPVPQPDGKHFFTNHFNIDSSMKTVLEYKN